MCAVFPLIQRCIGGAEMVSQYILRYLIVHADAKDTLAGICRWWLPQCDVEWTEAAIQAALEDLVGRGWVTRRQTTHAQTLYGLNKEKHEEIQAFLREQADTTPEC